MTSKKILKKLFQFEPSDTEFRWGLDALHSNCKFENKNSSHGNHCMVVCIDPEDGLEHELVSAESCSIYSRMDNILNVDNKDFYPSTYDDPSLMENRTYDLTYGDVVDDQYSDYDPVT